MEGRVLMPWESKTVEELRREFVLSAQDNINFSALCRKYGITRKTGYKWLKRHAAQMPLSDMSRKPSNVPNRTPEDIELLIVSLRLENPGWGAKKLKDVLEKDGHDIPSVKTVNNILNRYGCISAEESAKYKTFIRFEKDRCNEMWQTDFKGQFKMADNNYCFPLNIFDDHSRFVIKIAPNLGTANVVIPTFRSAFEEFGMPESVLSDNGAQFAGFRQGYTQFEKWLMNNDILPIHGRLSHPQTQGKIERFHRTMKDELLKHTMMLDIDDANRQLQLWRDKYNNIRPHESLGMKCPSEVYTPSKRTYCDKIKPYEYGGQFHVIRVNSWGYARFDKWQVYLSETMINEQVEFRPNPHGDSFVVCYRNFKIAEFSTVDGKLLNRSIHRL